MDALRIKAIDLGKRFNKEELNFDLFSGLSFSLNAGEVMGLIGNNGSGKSTLLKIIGSVVKPSTGSIELYGRVNSILDLGQNFSPELTGLENLRINLKSRKDDFATVSERIDKIVSIADIGDYLTQPVKTYSSGMLLRLGFALYTTIPCEILLIDEIISVGDLHFRNKCETIIQDLIKKGTTIILATHDLETINFLCNKSLLLHKGQCLFGATNNVLPFYVENTLENTLSKETFEKEKESYAYLSKLERKAELKQVRLISDNEKTTYADDITFEIQYEVHTPLTMGITMHLFYKQKMPLLSSCMNYGNIHNLNMHEKGFYRLYVTIPAATLAPDQYSIDLSFHDGEETSFRTYKSVFTFSLDKDEALQRIFKRALPPFPLLPRLKWTQERGDNVLSSILKEKKALDNLYKIGFARLPAISAPLVEELRSFYLQQFPESIERDENVISIANPTPGIRAICHAKIVDRLSDYMDVYFKDYKILLATFFAKPQSKESAVGFHQDPTLTDPENYDDFTLWIPLEDILEGDGEIILEPYSHVKYNAINFYTYCPNYLAEVKEADCIVLPCESGEPLIFFNRTVHGSKRNNNKAIRVAISIKLCHKDAKVYSYFNGQDLNTAERFIQPDDYYLRGDWNQTQRPAMGQFDKTVKID